MYYRKWEFINIEYITPLPHAPGVYPQFLASLKIEAILTDGMGQWAADLFLQNNIQPNFRNIRENC